MKRVSNVIIITFCILCLSTEGYSQKYKERGVIRNANEHYNAGEYVDSEVGYLRALEIDPESKEAKYNLSGAVYKQERFEDAVKGYQTMAQDSTMSSEERALTHYNLGNSLFKQKELEKALDAYKESMRLNPNDMEAKFNYAYTKKMIEDQEDQEDQEDKDNEDDQDQDQDQEQDQDQDNQDQDNQDKNDQNQDEQNPNEQDQDEQEQEQQEQPAEGKIDKQAAEQMLDAVQMEEDKTREKIDGQKVETVGRSGKNW